MTSLRHQAVRVICTCRRYNIFACQLDLPEHTRNVSLSLSICTNRYTHTHTHTYRQQDIYYNVLAQILVPSRQGL